MWDSRRVRVAMWKADEEAVQCHGNKGGKAEMAPWKEIWLMEYNFKDRNHLYIFIILEKWLVKEEITENE